MSRYDDFELAMLEDRLEDLFEAVAAGKVFREHVSDVFRELSPVLLLLGKEAASHKSATIADARYDLDADEMKKLRDTQAVADDLLKRHRITDLEELDEFIPVPLSLDRDTAIQVLSDYADNNP